MTLKFGDPQSIEERDRGRIAAILQALRCPNPMCADVPYPKEIAVGEQKDNSIDWVCWRCNEIFTTDLDGKVIWSKNGWEEDTE